MLANRYKLYGYVFLLSHVALFLLLMGSNALAQDSSAPVARISNFYGAKLVSDKPAFSEFWIDSLGEGRSLPNSMLGPELKLSYTNQGSEDGASYRSTEYPDVRTQFRFKERCITIRSQAGESNGAEPFQVKFDCRGEDPAYATLLGGTNQDGSVRLPAVLHIPGQGSLRITGRSKSGRSKSGKKLSLGYQANRDEVLISFPAATPTMPWVEFNLEVISTYPDCPDVEKDARFNGFRRGWLNMLQLSAEHRTLANRAGSDVCGLVYHGYSEIAMLTSELAEGVSGPQLLRESLDLFLAGKKAYGMPGYQQENQKDYQEASLDTWPSLLIAAHNYYQASKDDQWVKANIDQLTQWGQQSLDTDRNGNGLLEFYQSGNLGECRVRPANWWDCVNFGHEDAYSNALAYRAFVGLSQLCRVSGKAESAIKFEKAAKRIKAIYYETFYNPKSGMIAGWKSRDGDLHDYAFPYLQGVAITYGLIDDRQKANQLLDAMFKKMKEVNFHRFELGLPGNLVNIPQGDYFGEDARWGGSNAFQVYENGGASANHVYFVLAALYELGRREEADQILFPILDSFEQRRFQGAGPQTQLTNDWLDWDGNPHGYEGLLVDNYLVVKAVLVRQGLVDSKLGIWKNRE